MYQAIPAKFWSARSKVEPYEPLQKSRMNLAYKILDNTYELAHNSPIIFRTR
jgi:hypothetical protein